MGRARLSGQWLVRAAAVGAAAATAHSLLNLRRLRVPPTDPPPVPEPVSVLLPLRDEAHRVRPCLEALLAQEGLPRLEILVLDDGSSDGTSSLVEVVVDGDSRVTLLRGDGPPVGWLGKPAACHRLAEEATGDVLVFVDADVVVAPTGIAATVALLRTAGLDLVSPYPRQESGSIAERVVQPLLQWSWLTFLPLHRAERSSRASMAVANGQLMACDADGYRVAGGHAAVRDQVLDDVELARAFRRAGRRVAVADGTEVATCRMYTSSAELREGYTKSLWTAFGSPAGAAAVCVGLVALYVVPPVAALTGSGAVRRAGIAGTAAAVAGRAVVARRVGGRAWPDSLAHPVSVAALVGLTAESFLRRRRGTLTWKGRAL